MKPRQIFFTLILLLSYTGSVGADAWRIWDHLRDFHCVEHVCHHDCDACAAHHKAALRCNCPAGHGEADRQLYIASNADASHRHHPAPVADLPAFRGQHLCSAALLPVKTVRRMQCAVPLSTAPLIGHQALRAPPARA